MKRIRKWAARVWADLKTPEFRKVFRRYFNAFVIAFVFGLIVGRCFIP